MTDARDLESSLAEMDRKLRELQRELALVSQAEEPAVPPAPEPAPAPEPPPPEPSPPSPASDILEQAAARVAELSRRIDELARLRDDLDEATRGLQAEQKRAVTAAAQAPSAAERSALPAAGDVAVNAGPFPDIATLSAFEHALARVDGVEDAVVRSFEGNRALVDVRLGRPIDLAAALRGTVPFAFDVVAAGRGELTLTLRLPTI
jgi:hypothetical protein